MDKPGVAFLIQLLSSKTSLVPFCTGSLPWQCPLEGMVCPSRIRHKGNSALVGMYVLGINRPKTHRMKQR